MKNRDHKSCPMAPALAAWLILGPAAVVAADAPLTAIDTLSHEAALKAAQAATRACEQAGYHVATAVVGRDGRLMAFLRMPLAGPHTIEVAQRKAYTALTYQSATLDMADRAHLANTPGVLLLGGGLPVRAGGRVVGAIAVSGAPGRDRPGDVDEECASAGTEAIAEDLEFAQ